MILFIPLCLVAYIASLWSCLCSYRTYVQRRALWGRLLQIDVSFDAHYWRLLTFRNPWKLYPADVRAEVER